MGLPLDVYVDPGAGSDVTGDGSIGNPYASMQHAFDSTTHGTDGTRYNIKSGATDTTGNTSLTLQNSTPDAPLWIQGYTATAGDGGKGHIDTGTATPLASSYNYIHVQDMQISSSNAVGLGFGVYSTLVNCTMNCSVSAVSQYQKIIGNVINGTLDMNSGSDARFNKITHNTGYGIKINGQSVCHHNIIISESGAAGAILLSGHDSEAVNNSCYAPDGATYGIRGDDASYVVGAYNNLLEGYATAFSSVADVNKSQMFCNSSYAHATLESFLAEPWYQSAFNNNALAESPFLNAASGDFTPRNIVGVSNGFGVVGLFRGAVTPSISAGGGNTIEALKRGARMGRNGAMV